MATAAIQVGVGFSSRAATRRLPMFSHHVVRYEPDHEQQAHRNDDQIVQMTDDRNEVRDEIDRTEKIRQHAGSQRLGEPRDSLDLWKRDKPRAPRSSESGPVGAIFQIVRFPLCAFEPLCANARYSTGRTTMVSTVLVMSPPITTVASGHCTFAPALVEIAIGRNPRLACEKELLRIRNRNRTETIAPRNDHRKRSNLWLDSER